MINTGWYVGCASSQLRREPLSSQLLDRPVVVFRDAEGKPHALLDRCCHRGFPLSRGKVVDGGIQCGFHGWTYNVDGSVARVPSLPPNKEISSGFGVPTFHCAEKDGYVWLWAGDGEPEAVPELPELRQGNWLQGSRVIECNYVRALETTFDAAHIYFLHPSHPANLAAVRYGFSEGQQEILMTPRGCICIRPPTPSGSASMPDFSLTMEFILPGRIRFGLNGRMYMTYHAMPMGPHRCRMDWVIAEPVPTGDERIRWMGESDLQMDGGIIEEDRCALELTQSAYLNEGEDFECSVEADVPTLLLRRIVRAAERGEFRKEDFSPQRRIISMMRFVAATALSK